MSLDDEKEHNITGTEKLKVFLHVNGNHELPLELSTVCTSG